MSYGFARVSYKPLKQLHQQMTINASDIYVVATGELYSGPLEQRPCPSLWSCSGLINNLSCVIRSSTHQCDRHPSDRAWCDRLQLFWTLKHSSIPKTALVHDQVVHQSSISTGPWSKKDVENRGGHWLDPSQTYFKNYNLRRRQWGRVIDCLLTVDRVRDPKS